MKESEEFLIIKSLRYNVHIFHYVNGKLSLKKTLTFTFIYRIAINYNFTYVYIFKIDMFGISFKYGKQTWYTIWEWEIGYQKRLASDFRLLKIYMFVGLKSTLQNKQYRLIFTYYKLNSSIFN